MGKDRDWNIDLIPKLSLASGEFTDILYHTNVKRYVKFSSVAGSYVYKGGSIHKVPATTYEALSSPILSFFEKRRMKKFLTFIGEYDPNNEACVKECDLNKVTTKELFERFSLSKDTQDIIGHCIALYLNDNYLTQPSLETYNRIRLYMTSVTRFGNSPYIYPMYGLGELPQGFARLSAIYGGTYILEKPIEKIIYDENGKFAGVMSGGEIARAKICVADPSYFPSKVEKKGQVVRKILILSHPLANTNNAPSLQIIIPHKELSRKNDIYVVVLSEKNCVCPENYWLAIASTIVETDKPLMELDPVTRIVGTPLDEFTWILDVFSPISDGTEDNIFISKSYDSTSHFESICDDVKDMYKRITGKDLKVEGKVARFDEDDED